MKIHLVDKGTFSVGINWKYPGNWGYEYTDDEYKMKPRYNSLKEEMLNYNYLSHDEVNKIANKAKQHIQQSTIAKSVKDRFSDYKPITMDCLICICLYCDYSALSRDFTLSFRKRNEFELISQIKKRNEKYYHWSKILKNTIWHYGQDYDYGTKCLSPLRGPFYCGMSIVLNIPQFNMYIHCPLSTSIQIAVAMKFSGDQGMILEMDNSKGKGHELRGMDCSWISRYKEEEERYVLYTNIKYN